MINLSLQPLAGYQQQIILITDLIYEKLNIEKEQDMQLL